MSFKPAVPFCILKVLFTSSLGGNEMKPRIAVALRLCLLCFFPAVQAASTYQNLALNPNDIHDNWTAANGYPHATSNSEYPAPTTLPANPEYYALNAIDGKTANAVETQNPAWGPNTIANPWWRVAFGKLVQVDSVVIWIRADWTTTAPIPHDSYWKSATLVFSDSSKVDIVIDSTAKAQGYKFTSRATNSLTITNLVPHTPGWRGWCALAEVQAWGFDTPTSVAGSILSSEGRTEGSGSLCYIPGLSSRSIRLPQNAHGVELYTAQGRRIWLFSEGKTGAADRSTSLPQNLAKGIYRLKYIFD
jgi:hypothetical protein